MQTTVKELQARSQQNDSGVDVSTHKTLGHSSHFMSLESDIDIVSSELGTLTDLGSRVTDTSGAVVSTSERNVVYPHNVGSSINSGLTTTATHSGVAQVTDIASRDALIQGDHNTLVDDSPAHQGANRVSLHFDPDFKMGVSSFVPSLSGLAYKSCTDFSPRTPDYTELGVPLVNGSKYCQILHMRHNGIDNDLILLCQSHTHDNIVLKPANSFKVFRCSNLVFKSCLGKIELSGLNGGSGKSVKNNSSKQPNINIKAKSAANKKMYVKREINNAMLEHANEAMRPVENVESFNLTDTIKWYSKNWDIPYEFKFMMVRGQPVLEVFDEGVWHNVGLANKVYTAINDINELKRLASFGPNERRNIAPVMEDIVYPTFEPQQQSIIDETRLDSMGRALAIAMDAIADYGRRDDIDENHDNDAEGDPLDELNDLFGGGDDNNDGGFGLDPHDLGDLERIKHNLIPLILTRWDDGYSIGEATTPIVLNKQQFDLFSRFAKYFDVTHVSEKFINEVLQIPFEPWTPKMGLKLGNFTGLKHPVDWDGVWRGDLVPINEGDFISSFHDMMTNNDRSLEQGFVNWWSDAGENFISGIMNALLPFTDDTGHGSWLLNENVQDRIGVAGGFVPDGREFEIHDNGSGLLGAGRGDTMDIGRSHPLIAISDIDSDNSREPWSPELFNFRFDSSLPINFQGRETPTWGKIFKSISTFTQLQNSFRIVPATDIPQFIGARFQPSISVQVTSAAQNFKRRLTGVTLVQSQIGSDYPIVYKPSFESLAALNPQAAYSSVSSANRSYTVTPYGDLGDLVYLHKITNLYISKNVVNMFLPCFRMLKFAATCERGSYDANRGGMLLSQVMEFYSQGALVQSTQVFLSTIRFVSLSYYLNNMNSASMQTITNVLKGPRGRMAFMGSMNGDQSHDFILQLLMLGADVPMFSWLGAAYDLNATPTGNIYGFTDVASLFRESSIVNIVVFMGVNAAPFTAGPITFGTVVAGSVATPVTVVDIYYNLEDIIGSYISAGWNYWSTRAYNMALQLGCTDFWQQAMFFLLHNCSVSDAATLVDRYAQWSDGVNSPTPPVDAVFPYSTSRTVTSTAPMKYQFCSGVEGDSLTSAGANWDVVWGDLSIRVPQESGFEYLVIFGFCEPTKRTGVVVPFDPISTWSARFWAPEFMSQSYAETNREFFYVGSLYNKTKAFTAMPSKILNLYNQSVGRDNKYIPQGMLSVAKYYSLITASNVHWDTIQPTIGWILSHSSVYSSIEVLPYQRPEFLAYVSNYTSARLTVWGPSPYEPLTTPKLTNALADRMDNNVFGVSTYEIALRMNTSQNTPLNLSKEIVQYSYAALNLAEHYIVLTLSFSRQSKKGGAVAAIGKSIYPSFRLRDHHSYKGANFTLYKTIYYDIEFISPIAVTNLTNSAAITVSKTLNTYMSVASTDWHTQTDMADPDANMAREQNFGLIDTLFDTPVEIVIEKGSNSQQELESIAPKSGITVSAGGLPVARS